MTPLQSRLSAVCFELLRPTCPGRRPLLAVQTFVASKRHVRTSCARLAVRQKSADLSEVSSNHLSEKNKKNKKSFTVEILNWGQMKLMWNVRCYFSPPPSSCCEMDENTSDNMECQHSYARLRGDVFQFTSKLLKPYMNFKSSYMAFKVIYHPPTLRPTLLIIFPFCQQDVFLLFLEKL